jgi:predicted amidohydrolase YtcJ
VTSTLYRNGVVHTPADPFAEAILVDDGTVAWVGAEDSASGYAARADVVVDLDGALVTPAFVDAHVHVLETALALDGLDLSAAGGVHSLTDALDAIHRAAVARAAGDAPLLGFGWDEHAWPEGRRPSLAELDAAAGGAPAYLARVDVHSALVTGTFAERAGLPRLAGWHDDGWVTGDAHHVARDEALHFAPARRTALYRSALAHAAAQGIVSVHEMSAPFVDTRAGLIELLETTATAQSGLPLVVGYRAERCVTVDDAHALLAAIPGLTGIGGDLDVDGSLGSRTAALRAPYADAVEEAGALYLTAEQIANHVAAVTRAGVHAGFHVIGDRAMDELLLGLRAAAEVEGMAHVAGAGHRIEHAEMIDAMTLAQLVLLGARVSAQPAFDATWGGPDRLYAARLGAGRAVLLNPLADLTAAGVPLAFGSDSPVTPVDPWAGVRAAVRHSATDQRISGRAAFRAATRGGWRLAGLDGSGAGELRVGAPAHLAVWRAPVLTVEPGQGRLSTWSPEARAGTPLLPDLSPDAEPPVCLRTVRDGVTIFDALD